MKSPDISVIICTCNRADRLAGLFKDLESQIIGEPGFPWEIVLVDNNSTDRTRELVEKWREEGVLDVRYVFEKRQGKCFALNTGIGSARGELLAFTDDDVKLDKYWISSIHEASLGYPHSCFGGRVLPMGDIPLPPWLTDIDAKYRIYGGALVKHDHGAEPEEYGPLSNPPIGANMFVRKQIFEKHGYFNTKLGYLSSEVNIGSEDSEIMHRFRTAGEAILYYPKALVHHPVPVDRINKAYFRKWWWGNGRGKARWFDVPRDGVRYLNVPRYLFRVLATDMVRWITACAGQKEYKRFYREMRMLHTLGTIYEFYMSGEG